MALSVPMKRDAGPSSINIHQQISELERAIAFMRNCSVVAGYFDAKQKDFSIGRLEAALASLIYLRDNREAIVAAVQQSARTA